jgi:hypothetical protein
MKFISSFIEGLGQMPGQRRLTRTVNTSEAQKNTLPFIEKQIVRHVFSTM